MSTFVLQFFLSNAPHKRALFLDYCVTCQHNAGPEFERLCLPKRRLTFNGLRGVISQKIVLFKFLIDIFVCIAVMDNQCR
jgi:hypothetical protein